MKLVRVSYTSLLATGLVALGVLLTPVIVHAGPIELFYSAEQDPASPDEIVAPYQYGGGGLFISQDAGKSYSLMCMSQANPKLSQTGASAPKVLYSNGSIYISTFDGLWKGDKNGCNFALLPELMKFVSDVAADPLDPKRVYAVTSVASPAMNGIYMSDGTGPFAAFGAQEQIFVNTIHVVKKGTARRFYETGVVSDTMTNKVTYSVRVSDDDAKTFTNNPIDLMQFGMDEYAPFSIMAIDPTNPDRVIARIDRDKDSGMKDTLLESLDAGKTFRSVMELGDLQAAAFTPDGKLYFGDNDQNERKFYLLDKAGGEAQMIGSGWKVSCLNWDDSKKRMLACYDFRMGTADLDTGMFNMTLDMRCAGSFVECPGASMSSADACKTQLLAAYCGYGHYPAAPLCMPYDTGPDADALVSSAGYACKDGMVTDPNAGDPPGSGSNGQPLGGTTGSTTGVGGMSGGAVQSAGSGAISAGSAGAGATTSSGAGIGAPSGAAGATGATTAPASSSGGCSCALAESHGRDASSPWLLGMFGVLGYGIVRRRRSR
jgi:MYXO-CTERM domain-containing protein